MPKTFLRNLTGKQRSRKSDAQLGVVLAFIAGAINAGGFLAAGQYTSHMTGIVSGIADHLALHHWHLAIVALGFVLSFLTGAVTSTLIIRWARRRGLHSEYALALMLESLLLLAFGISASHLLSISTILLLLCFLMGLQNAIITKISNAEIRTTHVTGIVTDIGIELGRYLTTLGEDAAKRHSWSHKLRLHTGLLFAFLTGGVGGAFAFQHYGYATTIPLSFLLLILAAVPIWDDVRRA